MSEYENINQKIVANKGAMRKEIMKALEKLFAIVVAVILVVVGLNFIGFISDEFMVILLSITVCTGSFNAGRAWTYFKL